MVVIIEGDTANEIFKNLAIILLNEGSINDPRGQETLELSDVWLTLNNPSESILTMPERDLDLGYLSGETEWYESGSLLVKDIAKHSKFWNHLADSNGTVNSNYGFLTKIEKHAGKSQLEWVIERLRQDPHTRQAIMNYNQPRHKYEGVKDFVCTISQQFIQRNGKLDSIVLMRSNDVIYGLSYDMPWFTGIQEQVSKETGIPMGKYHHYAASMHVYRRHFKMIEDIANANV